jgi:hypothetical protein
MRSSLTGAQFAGDAIDLEALGKKADVDAVLTGTLLKADDQLRVTAQLAEIPGGTVRWSQSMVVRVGDIFQLQDALTNRIVESLAVPLSARDRQRLKQDVPASAKAYEFYLRANQLAYQAHTWTVARDLYQQCVEEDPRYAPAWARLARLYRVIGMYSGDGTDEAYARAEDRPQSVHAGRDRDRPRDARDDQAAGARASAVLGSRALRRAGASLSLRGPAASGDCRTRPRAPPRAADQDSRCPRVSHDWRLREGRRL